MPFKSDKQKTYLAINEPEVYKKFKKEENMYKVKKRAKGGKATINYQTAEIILSGCPGWSDYKYSYNSSFF